MKGVEVNGIMYEAESNIQDQVVGFYKSLYQEPEDCRPTIDGLDFASLDESDKFSLERESDMEEIIAALQEAEGDKDPGPDGFTIAFFQKCLLISNSHNAFVGGRQILNSVLIANECLDSRLKSGVPGVIIKLDIEKAYDLVNWNALFYLMERMGFREKWGRWMKAYIITIRFSVLINGSPTGFFGSLRGLRQGDSLSPLLFLLVMEVLSRLLKRTKEGDFLRGFQASPNARGCLKVYVGKSEIVPVGEVGNLDALACILCCKVGRLPMSYLGMPLGAHFKDALIWNPILERVEKKLSGWKQLYLSKGVEVGGLGIQKIGLFNQTLLGKWFWQFGKEATHLWSQVIATKYGEGSGGWCTRVMRGTHGCGLWKNIRKGANNFFGHMVYAAGEGNRIRFWHDPLSGPIPLKELYLELFACAVNSFNEWELWRFYSFYEHVSARIPSGEGEDILIWQLNRSGVFDVRSFYIALLKALYVSFPWQSIWCVKVPKRVSFFLWTAARNGILTIDNLVKKNLPLVNWCCLCRRDEETVDHLLLHCKLASTLWSEVLIMFGVQWVMSNTIVSLLFAWRNWLGTYFSKVWNMVPACLMRLVWKERNVRTFEDIERPINMLKNLLVRTLFEWSRI
ncbi:uncharacterized protein LOC136070428 [Quercus suber]|uniref:uncharacterized protein LOC136070428 n=1 Tax=Quercus suber TaxID=58331 RepID=UPI0032E014DE